MLRGISGEEIGSMKTRTITGEQKQEKEKGRREGGKEGKREREREKDGKQKLTLAKGKVTLL